MISQRFRQEIPGQDLQKDRINFQKDKADKYNRGDNGLSPDVTAEISSRRRLKQMKYMKEFSNQYNRLTT